MLARNYFPPVKYGAKWLASDSLSGRNDFTTVRYVDGDHGSDTNNGATPTSAFATIQAAINASSAQDVIYIRQLAPSATDGSEPGQYVENLTIPYTKHGLSLIGMGSSYTKIPFGGPKIKNASAGVLLDVLAPYVHLENIQFNCTRNSGTYGIYLGGDTAVQGYAIKSGSVGFSIVNCLIKNGGRNGVQYGVEVIGGYGGVISNCTFDGCLYGLNLDSHLLPGNGHTVEYCNFKDINGELATVHVNIPAGLEADFNIDHCNFDLATKMIVMGDGINGVISFCTFCDGSTATVADSTGKIEIPAALDEVGVVGCYGGGNALIAQAGN